MPLGVPDITYPDSFELPVINSRPATRLPYFKEHPTPGKGRIKGSHNKIPYDLKRDLVEAAAEVGFDGEGEQGLKGYLKHLAIRYPKCFSNLLGKVLPAYASVDINASVASISAINITSVPSDHYVVSGAGDASSSPRIEYIPPSEPIAPIAPPAEAEQPDPRFTALENRLMTMDHTQLLELAKALKLDVGT